MKTMRRTKLTASLLAIMMLVMSISTLVSAANLEDGTATVSIKNTTSNTGVTLEGKQFELYRVMDATVDVGEEGEDDTIAYTINAAFQTFFDDNADLAGTTATDLEAYDFINSYKGKEEELVTLLRAYVIDTTITATATASSMTTTSNGDVQTITSGEVDYGYYVIVDAEATGDKTGLVPATSLVTVASTDVVIDMKGSLPTINKEVWHDDATNENDAKDSDKSPILGTSGSWDVVADYEVGDIVEYRITATVPSDLTGYTDYTYIISDTLSAGISYNNDVKVYTSASLSEDSLVSGDYHWQNNDTDYTWQLQFDMLKIANDSSYDAFHTFYIYYTGTVTEDAVVAKDYESNTVTLEYSNNPYDKESTDTVTDTVYSYTFELDVTKTKGDGSTPLADAEFGLYAIYSAGGTEEQLYLVPGVDANTYYIGEKPDGSSDSGTIITDATGKFTIYGLNDEVSYILREVDAPDGYNVAPDVAFDIEVTYNTTGNAITSLTDQGSNDLATTTDMSGLEVKVINTSASLLPETGGMGTTLFMIIGATMMFGAAVILVVKRATKVTVIDL